MTCLSVIGTSRTTGLLNEGFLGTSAPFYADLVLLLEVGMGAALLIGAFLARTRKYRWHACCQSAVVVLNFVIIVLAMEPSFQNRVAPRIPAKLSKPVYALATAHALLGSVTEIAALYIVLAAGSILPPRYRFTDYKLWMRSVLVLWWIVLLLGIATYARWYIRF